MAKDDGILRLPPEEYPENPLVAPETIKSRVRQPAPRTREEKIVVKDGKKYKKIIEFPFPDRWILLGDAEPEPPKVNPLRCEKCGFIGKTESGLRLHKYRKHPKPEIVKIR